ncbi:MAG: ferrous iron transport protein B [Candidatus Gastranaerophilales bacterium]|nr:ferrous iron transport protein B [Candidatus Gastranaerophilales bacterium]
MQTLDKLKIGHDAVITSIDCDDRALRRHILDMGLTPGVEVTLVKTAPMGNPLEIRLRGYELTLRKEDAAKIKITNIHDAHIKMRENRRFKSIEHLKIGETPAEPDKRRTNPIKGAINFALAGNQNSGKTTLFNRLTGSNRHVGNFPGVTVERTDGVLKNDSSVTVTDLPGIYSLSPYSNEEIVTRNFILNEKPNGIINIVDAENIERNLYLTLQLIELNIPMVIALNMMDEVTQSGGNIDINGLEAALGIPVIPISALKNEGIEELIEHALNVARYREHPKRADFCHKDDPVHRCIHSIAHLIEDHALNASVSVRFAATKLTEGDSAMFELLSLDENEINIAKRIISEMETDKNLDKEAALADMRFTFIEGLCLNFVQKPKETIGHLLTEKADRILTGKYTAIPTFIIIMAIIFYLTFGSVGSYLSLITDNIIDYVTNITDAFFTAYGLNPVVHSLIIDGVFAGVGAVLSFLPIIVVLFFFLSILEDSGYMARVAFIMDKALRKIGLSGRSFVPMLMGFGCSVPAIMATRTLPSERDRKMTIMLTPFMSCSAKLPIYALFTAAFFKENQVQVIVALYAMGIITGLIFIFLLKLFAFKGAPVPFVMELPNYRMPTAKNVWRLIYAKAKDFVTRAFTIIFLAAIVIWVLQNFDSRLNLVADSSKSLLALIGNFTVPLFYPLGIDDWRISTAFITGFMAKESVVSTLTVLLGGDTNKLPELFTKTTAFVFLVFSLLYTPCVAAIATVRRELGRRWAVFVIFVQCLLAWLAAYIVYVAACIFGLS